jgi:hypothetical protein
MSCRAMVAAAGVPVMERSSLLTGLQRTQRIAARARRVTAGGLGERLLVLIGHRAGLKVGLFARCLPVGPGLGLASARRTGDLAMVVFPLAAFTMPRHATGVVSHRCAGAAPRFRDPSAKQSSIKAFSSMVPPRRSDRASSPLRERPLRRVIAACAPAKQCGQLRVLPR